MKSASFATLLERFFIERLMRQRQVSPHTVSSYRDTFRLLLHFADRRLHKPPSDLALEHIDAPLITGWTRWELGDGMAMVWRCYGDVPAYLRCTSGISPVYLLRFALLI